MTKKKKTGERGRCNTVIMLPVPKTLKHFNIAKCLTLIMHAI